MPFFPSSRKNGRRRRREDDGVRVVAFEIDTLEFVQASDDIGLLRVGGCWTAPANRALGDIVLSVDRGEDVVELSPLPDLNGVAPVASPSGEAWRGAFTIGVDLIDDPRSELALVAGSDARVALPRPGEWAEMQEQAAAAAEAESEAIAPDLEPESPVVADLIAKLDEVAQIDDGAAEDERSGDGVEADAAAPEPVEATGRPASVEAMEDPELASLRSEVELLRVQLHEAQTALEVERRRREALDEEMRTRLSVEDDLRNAMAMQEAELATAVAQASQRVRQAERRRDVVAAPGRPDNPEHPRAQPAGEDFLARLERARRLSETA